MIIIKNLNTHKRFLLRYRKKQKLGDNKNPQFTDHCFTGDYPVIPQDFKNQTEKNNQLSLLSNFTG